MQNEENIKAIREGRKKTKRVDGGGWGGTCREGKSGEAMRGDGKRRGEYKRGRRESTRESMRRGPRERKKRRADKKEDARW